MIVHIEKISGLFKLGVTLQYARELQKLGATRPYPARE
ncbi:hypothetical protein GAGA_0482 [Paraglaciecola agarilytica NO2]|uniref:Uncharacterized protein n=1 Tax=Paraglaciecola agarilytica NO2 TaxID=1125747 RepID=A0ABQ0I1Z9_9ALTE|nr:hypothetical protein GAGA_0482 [Paraglaciecola agarilytica NO2]